MTTRVLEHAQGRAVVVELGDGRRRVSVELADPATFSAYRTVETSYPIELIEQTLIVRGPADLGYSIRREEHAADLQRPIWYSIFAYVDEEAFRGKRVLDFGCGAGASSLALARTLPEAEIVGVDLDPNVLRLAELKARHYSLSNLSFAVSPGPLDLPAELGSFDYVCLCALFEHLLPEERTVLMPKLWSLLRPDGIIFVNGTPHRYYPLEYHTTGLPLLNYVPDRWALGLARRLSPRVKRDASWSELLRAGIRGGTDGEVIRDLRAGGDARPLTPSRLGTKDVVDVWYRFSVERRPLKAKAIMRYLFKAVTKATGSSFAPGIILAVRKTPADDLPASS